MKTRTTERAIGEHCASLIKDGDTLQLGIGSIPDAVLQSLRDKKDLGIHSEMFSDGAPVTTDRMDVDYIVTEYGIAALRGYTLRERARNLIRIAHPDFRAELEEEYEKRFHCRTA